MITKDNTPIYVQLADKIADDIASGKLCEDAKIPSVRELSANYEVNANTAMKTIEMLASNDIVYNKRGVGYFVTKGSNEKILGRRREEFVENHLPNLLRAMKQLNISFDDLKKMSKEINVE